MSRHRLRARHIRKAGLVLVFTALAVVSCKNDSDPKPAPPATGKEVGKAQAWLTMGDQSTLLTRQGDLSITTLMGTPTITIDTTVTMQEIEGFGAALTGSSAYLINKKMSAAQRSSVLKSLFNAADGIGISYLRMTMGASDFSLSDYTYNDMPAGETDYALDNFTIEKDEEDVVPVLQQILSVQPAVTIMGTPWSPPAWMKTNGNLKGGKLKTNAYDSYAQYFVKYIKAFDAHGIAIGAVSPQNEPLYSTANYPCMDMPAQDQLNFIKGNLGPAFQAASIDTKIIVYDHNWDNTAYATSIVTDPAAAQYVAGSAFHAYAGSVSAMTAVHNANPDKGLYFTEISGGEWATNFSDNLQWQMANIFIGTTKNWSKNALLWNLALDQNHGPTNNGCADCRGVVTINSTSGQVTKNVEYYAIGHFAKFVRPGAHRVSSTSFEASTQLDNVAFINKDGSKVLVVSNAGTAVQTFVVKLGQRQFSYTIPAKSVVSIIW